MLGRESVTPIPLQIMSDFEAILNAEIVEAGRVPAFAVISRAKVLAEILENHYSDRATLTPVVSPNEDLITWNGEIDEGRGFSLFVYIKKEDQSVEEELVVWHKPDTIYMSIRGILAVKDFEYALNRDKEYTYLDEKIKG